MLEPTLNYYCTQSPCKLRHLSYSGTSFCMPLSITVTTKPHSLSCTTSWTICHFSKSGWPKITWWGGGSDNYCCKVRCV